MPIRTISPRCRRFACITAAGFLISTTNPPLGALAHKIQSGVAQNSENGAPAGIFPSVATEALDRTPLQLPEGFEGRQNLLLLSWARDQAGQVESWTAVAQALQHTDFNFRVYRMLVSAQENVLYRWWDNASLRASETDPQLLHWSVPLYTDKTALRRSLGIAGDEHRMAAILVDRAGRVLWHAEGVSTEQTRRSLLAAAGGAH